MKIRQHFAIALKNFGGFDFNLETVTNEELIQFYQNLQQSQKGAIINALTTILNIKK